jgi:hypothetical protein
MVALKFNMLGLSFQNNIDILVLSYEAARDALEGEVERAADEAMAHQRAQEQGAPFVGERDGDGYVIVDHQQVLNDQYEMTEEALRTLRKAFAINLYHSWERGARRWTKLGDKGNHAILAPAVEALGMTLDPLLDVLRRIVNLLKHDRSETGEKLAFDQPDFIDTSFVVSSYTDWYDAILISEDQMMAFFTAVRASGPTVKTTWS